ncbi:hypothetical protein K491DRAFT_710597 [Lophiostoma macrostomum CBS 122681]|uniref:Uncharacterized protein n=1 Tax=Lophiostoma macrostomum CBS 122681 TaxID=1314788 RepID=A0A6A6TPP8_9PLEO|nr:hypothetical protein K491DRAFT_710597 [Lophiostoma macrostomum CBS 122681]
MAREHLLQCTKILGIAILSYLAYRLTYNTFIPNLPAILDFLEDVVHLTFLLSLISIIEIQTHFKTVLFVALVLYAAWCWYGYNAFRGAGRGHGHGEQLGGEEEEEDIDIEFDEFGDELEEADRAFDGGYRFPRSNGFLDMDDGYEMDEMDDVDIELDNFPETDEFPVDYFPEMDNAFRPGTNEYYDMGARLNLISEQLDQVWNDLGRR